MRPGHEHQDHEPKRDRVREHGTRAGDGLAKCFDQPKGQPSDHGCADSPQPAEDHLLTTLRLQPAYFWVADYYSTDSVEETADALQIVVAGLGAVQTPVRGPLAKKLIAVGRPAKFGRAEQTLTDASVRDT